MMLNVNGLSNVIFVAFSLSVSAANGTQVKQKQRNLRANQRNLHIHGCEHDNMLTSATVVIDGQINDWDLFNDFHKIILNEGEQNPDEASYIEVGKAYVKYDCEMSKLCVLALTNEGFILEPVGEKFWIKDYDGSNSALPYLQQSDVYIDDKHKGWEGCYTLAPGCYDNVEVHINWGYDVLVGSPENEALNDAYAISLNLQCSSDSTSSSPVFSPTDASTSAILSDTGICTADDLSGCDSSTSICKQAICTDGQCGFAPLNTGKYCGAQFTTEVDACVEGYFCEGLDCVLRYRPSGTACSTHTIPDTMDDECTKGICNNVGVCEPVPRIDESCGNNDFPRGPCDKGNICGPTGTCVPRYHNKTVICRESEGCCDIAEYCTGDSYVCPEDIIRSAGTFCRNTCEFCVNDPPEICDGVSGTCGDNIILSESVGIYAGELYDAGSVEFTATPIDGSISYKLCAVMTLGNDWTIDTETSDPIQIEIFFEESIYNIPRRYSYNYPSRDIVLLADGIYRFCTPYIPGETINFALRFDVKKGSDKERAWALPLKNSSTPSAFTSTQFMQEEGGEYFTWESCNPEPCVDCQSDSATA